MILRIGICLLGLFLSINVALPEAFGGTRFFFENFEKYSVGSLSSGSNNYGPFWATASSYCNSMDSLGITTNNPYAGNKSMRGNAWDYGGNHYDAITGLKNNHDLHANLGDYGGYACGSSNAFSIKDQYTNDLYIVVQIKFDSNFNNPNVGAKLVQLYHSGGVFYVEQYQQSLLIYGDGISSAEWYDGPISVDGKWHKYTFHISNSNNNLTVYKDDQKSDSRMPIRYTGGKISDVGIMWIHSYDQLHCSGSCGWQMDNIEFWNGTPTTAGTPPDPPTGLRIITN